jgi:lysozyme
MNRELLTAELTRDEGVMLKPYRDTVNVLTIGVGRNLDNGISEEEAVYLLNNDIDTAVKELDRVFPWWSEMPEAAQRALANMAFNLGLPRLANFTNMIDHLKAGRYYAAASEAMDSKWAKQVGPRAERIADLFRDAGNYRI